MEERKIDAVIHWVDGSDPSLIQKKMLYAEPGQLQRPDIAGATRYASFGEITYCVCSLLRNVPFLNCIYIITDNQVPPVEEAVRRNFPDNRIPVKIIDHKVIFRGYEEVLPTFNSGALDTMMWRIPGLSDYFIYLNDDFAVTAPLSVEDFFRDGKAVVNGYWHSVFTAKLAQMLKKKNKLSFRSMMVNSAKALGVRHFVRVPHVPRLYHKQVQERFWTEHPDLFRRNMSYRFRCADRIDNSSLVATIMALEEGAIVNYVKDDILYLEPRSTDERFRKEFDRCKRLVHAKYFCMNSLDGFSESQRKEILDWLADRLNIII